MDFSSIRPAGALVRGVGADASGPLSFMDVWDSMCRTILSAGQRRGAMMGCLRIDHPDIEAFIDAKRDGAHGRVVLADVEANFAAVLEVEGFVLCVLEEKGGFHSAKFRGVGRVSQSLETVDYADDVVF